MADAQCQHVILRNRTKAFALRLVRLFREIQRSEEGRILGRQLLRSGTSVAANYRACGRARSPAEFAAKMGVVVEEADETAFWLELLAEANVVKADRLNELRTEAEELLAIFAASLRTAKKGCKARGKKPSDEPLDR
jgi:four helix bundle protein